MTLATHAEARSSARAIAGAMLLAAICCCNAGQLSAVGPESVCKADSDCTFSYESCVSEVCSCDPAKCNGVCAGSACIPTACSTTGNRCAMAGFPLCDPQADDCYPVNGACSSDLPCPTFGGGPQALGILACGTDGFCHLKPPAPDRLSDLDGTPDLPVATPNAGEVFSDGSTLAFAWPTVRGPVIATVTTTHPQYPSDLSAPLWAAFLDTGSSGVRWSDGANPDGSGWHQPAAPPPAGPLFLVVASYQGSTLASTSNTMAFRVGSPWPSPGTDCDPASTDLAQCAAPQVVQACYEKHCERGCASDVDCAGAADGRCGYPTANGVRYCGVNEPGSDAGADGSE